VHARDWSRVQSVVRLRSDLVVEICYHVLVSYQSEDGRMALNIAVVQKLHIRFLCFD
jgi:hypothetical protein